MPPRPTPELEQTVAHLHTRLDQVQAETEANSASITVLLVSFLVVSWLFEKMMNRIAP